MKFFIGVWFGIEIILSAVAGGIDATNLTQFELPNGDTQISWITERPRAAATVVITKPNGEKTLVREKIDKVRDHVVVIPSAQAKGTTVLVTANGDEKNALFPPLKVVPAPTVKTKDFTIELQVVDPAAPRKSGVVRSGVPFAKGVLGDVSDVMLVDANDNEVECVCETFCKWDDGSIKWLTINFNADTTADTPLILRLKKRVGVAKKLTTPDLTSPKKILENLRCEITFADGSVATGKFTQQGLVSASRIPNGERLHFRGDFTGKPEYVLEAICTITASGFVNVDFRIITLRATRVEEVKSIIWKGFPKFAGANFTTRQLYAEEPRHDGFFQARDLAVYVPNFWQQYPKGAVARDGEFAYETLPGLTPRYLPENPPSQHIFCRYFWFREGGLYGFRHNMSLPGSFTILTGSAANLPGETLKKQLENPLFATATPKYYCGTGAFGPISPADGKAFVRADKFFDISFKNFQKTQDMTSDYGWMSYGDWFGERGDNWGNNEYDMPYFLCMQFARLGKIDYLRRALDMSRHYTSIDVRHTEKPGRVTELVYPHKIGHNGLVLDPKSKLNLLATHHLGDYTDSVDRHGGHDFMAGSFYVAALFGDTLVMNSARRAIEHQAIYMSVDVKITLERAAGWYLTNQGTAYLFTGNPLHLNAARLIVDKVVETQNPQTGCLDLPANPDECKCPDKAKHRGGKAFSMGVLTHGMRIYYEITGDERAKKSILLSADWLINKCYDASNGKFRYTTACPKRKVGKAFWSVATEGLAYAAMVTGNRKYADIIHDQVGQVIYAQPAGIHPKNFVMNWCVFPNTMHFLRKMGYTEFKEHQKHDLGTKFMGENGKSFSRIK